MIVCMGPIVFRNWLTLVVLEKGPQSGCCLLIYQLVDIARDTKYNITLLMWVEGLFSQSSGSSTFGTVKTQATISGAFSGGSGSVQSTGFGGFQKQPSSSPGTFSYQFCCGCISLKLVIIIL